MFGPAARTYRGPCEFGAGAGHPGNRVRCWSRSPGSRHTPAAGGACPGSPLRERLGGSSLSRSLFHGVRLSGLAMRVRTPRFSAGRKMLRMTSFLHTMVRVTDPQRSRSFYEALAAECATPRS